VLKRNFLLALTSLLFGVALPSCGAERKFIPFGQVDYVDNRTYFDDYLRGWIGEYQELMWDNGLEPDINILHSAHCVQNLIGYSGAGKNTIGLTTTSHDNDGDAYRYINEICTGDSLHDKALTFHELTHAYFDLGHSKYPSEIQYADIPADIVLQDWTLRIENLLIFIRAGGDEEDHEQE